MFVLALALIQTAAWVTGWVWAASGGSPTGDPIVFFLSQGVLGVSLVIVWREYLSEKRKREELTTKLIDDIVPLLARAAEVITKEGRERRGGTR